MSRSKTVLAVGFILLGLFVVLVGCGGGEAATTTSQPASGSETTSSTSGETGTTQAAIEAELPGVLRLGTHPMGSTYNALGAGLATVLSQNTSIEVKAIATSGPSEWEPMFASGDMDMGVANSFDSGMGYLGQSDYADISDGEGFPIRLITVGSLNRVGVVVPRDSDIKTAADLKGKRFVGEITGSAGITAMATAYLANQGLSPSDVKMVAVPGIADGVRAVIEGRADATTVAYGTPMVQELDASKGARFIGIDPSPEAMARLQAIFPAKAVEVKPGAKAVGIAEPTFLMGYDNYLVARADLSDAAAYAVTKVLWEHQAELKPIHAAFTSWTTDRYVSDAATVPYHPGAIQFYKEVGVWTSAMDELQERLLSAKK